MIRYGKGSTAKIPAMLAALGEQQLIRLSVLFEGQVIPSKDSVRRHLRRQAVVREYLAGTGVADLVMKYRLTTTYVKRILTTAMKQRRRAEQRAADQKDESDDE